MLLVLKKVWLIVVILLLSQSVFSQDLFPHSLSVGLNTGVAANGYDNPLQTALGVDLTHQRNWSRFFSFRTHLGINYFLPKHETSYSNYQERVEQGVNTALTVAPLFYFRKNDFSIYVGPGFGLGNQSDFSKSTITLNGEAIVQQSRYHAFLLVFRPVIGASFFVADSKDEIEVQFAPNFWFDIEALTLDNLIDQVGFISVTISYRFNFLEG